MQAWKDWKITRQEWVFERGRFWAQKMRKKNPELKKLDFWVIIAKGLAPYEQKCIHASRAEIIIEID